MSNIRTMKYEEIMKLPRLCLDDRVMLGCKACGKCCQNREDIIFTAYDVFRIAHYLQRTPKEITDRYCDSYIGHQSRLPIIHLKPIPPKKAVLF